MSSFIDADMGCHLESLDLKARDPKGQGTVEAAFAIPVVMILLLLLLQPAIILYDRIVMQNAAMEGCRVLATSSASDLDRCEEYIRRRLSAVPQMDIFHIHSAGCSWDISMDGSESSEQVSVRIGNKVKPLPLLDVGSVLLGLADDHGCLVIKVESSQATQPDWLRSSTEGSGDPSSWVGIDG